MPIVIIFCLIFYLSRRSETIKHHILYLLFFIGGDDCCLFTTKLQSCIYNAEVTSSVVRRVAPLRAALFFHGFARLKIGDAGRRCAAAKLNLNQDHQIGRRTDASACLSVCGQFWHHHSHYIVSCGSYIYHAAHCLGRAPSSATIFIYIYSTTLYFFITRN